MTRLLRGVGVAAGAAIVLLHLQILWLRLGDGSVLEPVVAGRWLISVALILLSTGIRRRGLSLVRGRSALIFWLLVVLLHGVGLAPSAEAVPLGAMPAEVFLIAAPLGLGVATLLWTGVEMSRRSGETPFALLRRARRPNRAVHRDLRLLAFSGPRAPPR